MIKSKNSDPLLDKDQQIKQLKSKLLTYLYF